MNQSDSNWTVTGLGDEVARPDRFAGGGAVAAMSLHGAAATAELVLTLSKNRRDVDPDDRQRLEDGIERCRRWRDVFARGIDEDIASLTSLMDAQRALRAARKSGEVSAISTAQTHLDRALAEAIETPLRLSREARDLLRDIEEFQPMARKFTVSDLGAAAATAKGAMTSLLLMAEVNIGLLSDIDAAATTGQEIEQLEDEGSRLADQILRRTRQTFRPDTEQDS